MTVCKPKAMVSQESRLWRYLVVATLFCGCQPCAMAEMDTYLSPTALAATSDGHTLLVACATANRVLRFDAASKTLTASFATPLPPSGLALSPDGRQLFVTCAAPESKVCIVDLATFKITATIPVGHTAIAPVPSPDGKTLYVCNQFNNDVSVIDLAAGREVRRIAVLRDPVAADITKDGRYLLVANQLPAGRADLDYDAAAVSVIDLAAGKVSKTIPLINGSGSLKDIRVSPDGRYAAVTHLVGWPKQPTTSVNFGRMHGNAVTLIHLGRQSVDYIFQLDARNRGAGNPWGLAWSPDGSKLVVASAGTHEIHVFDFPALLDELARRPQDLDPLVQGRFSDNPGVGGDAGGYIPFLPGAGQRIQLPSGDLGSRAVIVVGNTIYTANYFSDTLSAIDLTSASHHAGSIPLGPKPAMDPVRLGEFYFHDAALCREGWQSCSSCHPGDARVDGMNWDLLNDGIGNPKNTRNLLLAHKTPPVMSLGVRTNAEAAVRAGIIHILFTNQPESVAVAIDDYLKSLTPVPSPYLVHGRLSPAAKRGKKIFDGPAGCMDCHQPGLFTDLHAHDVGTRRSFDQPTDKFYTPTLIEVWRTAPYLHDGSAVTIRDVLTTRNPNGEHGNATGLSESQLADLCEYVLSL
jgi:YVTN family beta-propeller protein